MPGQQNREEFAEVVDTCYERISRGALSVTGDTHLPEEIVQETSIIPFRKFDSFSPTQLGLNSTVQPHFCQALAGTAISHPLQRVVTEHTRFLSGAGFSRASRPQDSSIIRGRTYETQG